jgi:pimeloyl-ACP methyl ester carboxylesterase
VADLDAIEARVRSRDGTDLAVHVLGDGPLVVLANGLGGSLPAWGPLLQHLAPRHRVVSWDYRGLYRSGPPPRRDAVTIADHADDLRAVLAWAGGGPAVLIGWSMGVQVVVEHALAHPGDVSALVLVAGAPGDPLATVLHTSASRCVVPPLTYVVEAGAAPFGAVLRAATAPSWAPAALRRLGILAPTADLDVFGTLAHDFARLDWRLYMRTIRAMARHDAWPRLGELDVPTLVVGGTRDLFLPARTLEAMAAAIPGAELWLVDGGTHYLPVEFPEALDARIDRFVAERVASVRAT